jgi:MFS family permease
MTPRHDSLPAAPAAAQSFDLYFWYLMLVLVLAGALSYIDRQILALMIGPVKRDLGINDTQVGLLIGLAFSVFYSVAMLPMAWLADTRSRRKVIGLGILSWSLMTAFSGLARNFGELFVARMGVGIGEAALGPAAYTLLSDSVRKEQLPFAVGIFAAAPFVGIGLANIVGGQVVGALESLPPVHLPLIGETRSWQMAFFIVGAPGLLISLLAFTLREPPRRGMIAGAETIGTLRMVWRFIRENKALFLLHFAGFLLLALQGWTLFGWAVEFFIREHGMARAEIGRLYGLIVLGAGLTGSIAAGRIATSMMSRGRVDAVLRLVTWGALVMAPLSIAMALVPSTALAIALIVPVTFFMAWPPGLGVAALQAVAPNQIRGRVVAVYLLVVNLLSVSMGPLIVGVVNDYVFRSEQAIGETLALLAAVTYPLAALALFFSLKPFRRALKAAEGFE